MDGNTSCVTQSLNSFAVFNLDVKIKEYKPASLIYIDCGCLFTICSVFIIKDIAGIYLFNEYIKFFSVFYYKGVYLAIYPLKIY